MCEKSNKLSDEVKEEYISPKLTSLEVDSCKTSWLKVA